MTVNLTCTQVGALLSFYIEDKLSCELKQFVEAHLSKCPTCRVKLETLKNMINSLREVQEKLSTIGVDKKDELEDSVYSEFKNNLSAYVDNELNDEDNIKMKKMIIANPKARQELENMYGLKKVMQNSFTKVKSEVKDDFSKYILRNIDLRDEVYGNDSFAKVVAIFIVTFAFFVLTAFVVFWI